MKLSVSAYRAHASAHKKILDTAYQLNYGSTSASHHATTSSNAPTCSPFQIDPPSSGTAATQKDNSKSNETVGGGGGGVGLGGLNVGTAGDDISSDDARTSIQSPRSQNTSREEDESSNANESDTKSPGQRVVDDDEDEFDDDDIERSQQNNGGYQQRSGETAKVATQSWRNLRAVMAYYNTLRKIKRTKSNQRWMKLRTTVQISSAMQKKPPLKREDSFLQRFSTRQIPETQETVEDTGSEGCSGDAHSTARRRRRTRKQPRTVVNPDENFYFYWLLVLTVCILYNLWTLIVRQSFPELQLLISNFWLACDSLSDIIFIMDVCVQLRTGYLEQGLMVYDCKKLAKHYLTSRAFLLDLAALCPLDLLQLRFGPQPLLRWPRFFKVYRAVNYYYMVESRTVYPNLWRVVNLIHILLILAHWFGCFYFLLSEAEGFQGDWVYPYRPGDYATLTRKYLGSLYWSTLTLTTIGDLPTPETNAEYVFTIVSYLIGVFIFATIVGQVGNVITNRNANRLEFERLLDGAKTYMRHHKVPGGMKRRVLRWYDYSWSRGRIQGGGDINTALGLLPDKLKTELALHVNLSVLKKVTIFQECQPEFLRDLVLKMKAYIFTPGDSICRKGEVAREMFIIADGILEVLSEAGKVLTSMKAGDFFGEIGILNLDGLNKRTADVRSVGYSELFSLSREDVLAAMKDYPEAQEILQALGRKRLMEVKASARQHAKESKDQHGVDPRGIVGKIKNEAKGLRNALRKSRTHRRSQESLELQPLHISSGHEGKGMLKRMPRVKSHDLSQEENHGSVGHGDQQTGETTISPLGAGLPLLARLRLLKERQDHEEQRNNANLTGTSPAILSPSPCSVKSPPPTQEEPEVIGAGLPLIQRLLMLKAKEERLAVASAANSKNLSCSQPTSPTYTTAVTSTRASFSGPPVPTSSKGFAVAKNLLGVGQGKAKISFKERLKMHMECSGGGGTTNVIKNTNNSSVGAVAKEKDQHQQQQQQHQHQKQQEETVPKDDETQQIVLVPSKECESGEKTEPPWSKLKKAAIVRENVVVTDVIDDLIPCQIVSCCSSSSAESAATNAKNRPSLTLVTHKAKIYRSIDDLSPEYSGLPFVKKLKILNERQKLEELESVMKTRSFSLDIPDTQPSIDVDSLTRSRSEGSAMHRDKHLLAANLLLRSLNSSNESNETPERKHLKSILKKLTNPKTEQESTEALAMLNRIDSKDFNNLMRAPTLEGYAARHSKLSKSVTFNRDTLQSPPHSANVLIGNDGGDGDSGGGNAVADDGDNLFSFPVVNSPPAAIDDSSNKINNSAPHNQFHHLHNHQESNKRQDLENCELQIISTKANHQMKFIKNTIEDDQQYQQYFGDILAAIKQVMSVHMEEVQEQFRTRFVKLEDEIRKRDDIINQLRSHIIDLERAAEESLTDSVETIVPLREQQSWEERNRRESDELRDLPQQTLQPQTIWPPRDSGNVVVDIDSATDTESDIGDSSETGEEPEYENSSHNWEIELLAAQIRNKRSASLDPSAGRPIKKRFNRAGSVDQNKKE